MLYYHKKGFSLVELMTVISLAALVMALAFPVFNSIDRGTRVASSVNLLKGALANTQNHALREIADREISGEPGTVPFRGGALVVTLDGQGSNRRVKLEIMEHHQGSRDINGILLNNNQLKGFRPIFGLDPIRLPVGAGLLGIFRNGTDGLNADSSPDLSDTGLRYVRPPFAIHFNERGKILSGHAVEGTDIATATTYRTVSVDFNNNGAYGEESVTDSNGDTVSERLRALNYFTLFDGIALEANGYNLDMFDDPMGNQSNLDNLNTSMAKARDFLVAYGKILHLNRFSGVIMRENGIGETLVNENNN